MPEENAHLVRESLLLPWSHFEEGILSCVEEFASASVDLSIDDFATFPVPGHGHGLPCEAIYICHNLLINFGFMVAKASGGGFQLER